MLFLPPGTPSRLALIVLALATGLTLGAETKPPPRIETVRITGNHRIPRSAILHYIHVAPGQAYDKRQLYREYWNLRDAHLFSAVRLLTQRGRKGMAVRVEVEEFPLLRSLTIRGIPSLTVEKVLRWFRETRVGVALDAPFDPARLPRARQSLEQLLDLEGRPGARVGSEVNRLNASSVEVVLRLQQNPGK